MDEAYPIAQTVSRPLALYCDRMQAGSDRRRVVSETPAQHMQTASSPEKPYTWAKSSSQPPKFCDARDFFPLTSRTNLINHEIGQDTGYGLNGNRLPRLDTVASPARLHVQLIGGLLDRLQGALDRCFAPTGDLHVSHPDNSLHLDRWLILSVGYLRPSHPLTSKAENAQTLYEISVGYGQLYM